MDKTAIQPDDRFLVVLGGSVLSVTQPTVLMQPPPMYVGSFEVDKKSGALNKRRQAARLSCDFQIGTFGEICESFRRKLLSALKQSHESDGGVGTSFLRQCGYHEPNENSPRFIGVTKMTDELVRSTALKSSDHRAWSEVQVIADVGVTVGVVSADDCSGQLVLIVKQQDKPWPHGMPEPSAERRLTISPNHTRYIITTSTSDAPSVDEHGNPLSVEYKYSVPFSP